MSTPELPPEAPPHPAEEMLLQFLNEHDAACPVCGYNLRALTRPICPECRHQLVLTVGATRVRIAWLLAALAPGFFSGIAAFFLLIPIVLQYVHMGTSAPVFNAVDLFGWCSGALAIVIAVRRTRFIALPRAKQQWWAISIWIVHVAALAAFILYAYAFM